MSAFSNFIQPCTGVSIVNTIKKCFFKLRAFGLGEGRGVKLSLFAGYMLLYDNAKKSTKILPELIKDFSKITRSTYKN